MSEWTTLAIQGGLKSVPIEPPHYRWPHIGEEQINVITAQLQKSISERDNSGVIGAFEKAFSQFVGRQYAVSFASGTSAIHAMCVASPLQPGDEILCPVYTFFATITPFVYEGVKPVFCDCDPVGNISIEDLRVKVSERTKAVIVTHMWGVPCDMTAIVAFCKEHSLFLFEDCSHAHFATWGGRRVGTFGDMAAYSLNQKAITAGEGGVFVTDNEEYRDRALRFGHYNNRCKKEISQDKPYYQFALTGMGLKLRAHPLAMALALNQITHAEDIENRRRANLNILIESARQYDVLDRSLLTLPRECMGCICLHLRTQMRVLLLIVINFVKFYKRREQLNSIFPARPACYIVNHYFIRIHCFNAVSLPL